MLRKRTLLVLALAGLGLWQTGAGAWIHVKARLAQHLLEQAWEQTLEGQTRVRPWPWADTWPVARLRIDSRRLDLIVLQGDSGRSLAFGPGMAVGSSEPGHPGTTLISAHRDTHFEAIRELRAGEAITLETTAGYWRYEVTGTRVIDSRSERVTNNPLGRELVLVTCYPFDAVRPGGPLRYVVHATLKQSLLES